MRKFKKQLLIIIAVVGFGLQANAQGDIEVTGFGGYTFKNSFSIYGGQGTVGDGGTFGGSLAVGLRDGMDIEFYYSRQESTLSAFSSFDNINFQEPGNVSYWMLGGVKNFQSNNPDLYFFTAVRLGGVTFSTKDKTPDNVTKFAASFGAGVKYFLSDNMGIKISGNMLLPIFDAGASLWFGGGGGGVGVSTWSPILQFNFNGGIFFRISK